MKTLTLAGLTWTAHSPSLFSHLHPEGRISIRFDGMEWRIAVHDVYGGIGWPTRDAAARLVADTLTLVNAEHLA